ncbi:MAG: type II toxin-antitoxin system prevent-host-death family antitoxin [Candidatus Brocadiia bacterium]|jgi:prevent-host-death family protein
MKFVTIRDFRNKTAAIRKALSAEHEIVLTANGRPIAVLADVDEDTFEEKLAALRRARAYSLLDRARARARETGADKLSMEEIDAEIAKTRRERRSGR